MRKSKAGEFEATLRGQVEEARRRLSLAREAGLPYEAHLHGARIRDLLEAGERHGVDTMGWIDRDLLASVSLS